MKVDPVYVKVNFNFLSYVWIFINIFLYQSDGKLLQEIEFPASQVTSVAFGGPQFDVLFVTTAARGDSQIEAAAGHLYKITGLKSVGSPAVKVNV